MEGAPAGGDSAEDRMYAKACQIVVESQKASTSWLQRQLRIGYTSAARLIERGAPVGIGTVHRFFVRHGITRKKRLGMPSSKTAPTS